MSDFMAQFLSSLLRHEYSNFVFLGHFQTPLEILPRKAELEIDPGLAFEVQGRDLGRPSSHESILVGGSPLHVHDPGAVRQATIAKRSQSQR